MTDGAVLERSLLLDGVPITATDTCTTHVSGADEIGHDLMGATFTDPDVVRDLTYTRLGVPRDAQKNEGMRGQ